MPLDVRGVRCANIAHPTTSEVHRMPPAGRVVKAACAATGYAMLAPPVAARETGPRDQGATSGDEATPRGVAIRCPSDLVTAGSPEREGGDDARSRTRPPVHG